MKIIDLNFELRRKIFHLSALAIPLCYVFTSRLTAILLLFVIAGCALYLDISRHYNGTIREFVTKFFTRIMRSEEASGSFRLSGVSFMMLGFFVTALLFPKNLVICSWLILIISDCLAALVGIKIGEPLDNGKSIAGASAFLSSAVFISILVYFFIGYNTSFIVIIISSIAATAVEFYSKQIGVNDNLLIPLAYCLSTVIFSILL
ncbi:MULTISPECIES: diacylglycerol/polyprenol kinase family protein [unclassified Rickettsia]|uniref:diacylglycerol/polyprenol kinase family protein n=1 Tax=unclassified Rickettsia TaxID=114295 RepID=UPI00313345AF